MSVAIDGNPAKIRDSIFPADALDTPIRMKDSTHNYCQLVVGGVFECKDIHIVTSLSTFVSCI